MVQKLLFWLSHLAKSEVRHWKQPRDISGKRMKKSACSECSCSRNDFDFFPQILFC